MKKGEAKILFRRSYQPPVVRCENHLRYPNEKALLCMKWKKGKQMLPGQWIENQNRGTRGTDHWISDLASSEESFSRSPNASATNYHLGVGVVEVQYAALFETRSLQPQSGNSDTAVQDLAERATVHSKNGNFPQEPRNKADHLSNHLGSTLLPAVGNLFPCSVVSIAFSRLMLKRRGSAALPFNSW